MSTNKDPELVHERLLILQEQDTIQDTSPFPIFEHPEQVHLSSDEESQPSYGTTEVSNLNNRRDSAAIVEGEDDENGAEILMREHRAHNETLLWHKRPTTLLICFTTSLFFLSLGISISSKITILLQKICEYLTVTTNIDNCQDSSVQQTASSMQSGLLLIRGGIACLISGKLGELSDRHGRRPIFIIIGVLTCAAKFFDVYLLWPSTFFNYWLFLLSNVIDGFSGGATLVLSMAMSYITDIIDPHKRNVSMGYVMGSFFIGIGAGPLLGSVVIKTFGDIFLTVYIDAILSFFFLICVVFIVPESRSLKLRKRSQSIHFQRRASFASEISAEVQVEKLTGWNYLQILVKETFHSLRLLWIPKHPTLGYIPRCNVIILLIIDTMNMLVVQSIGAALVLYTTYRFNWSSITIGYFISASGIGKAVVLYVISPIFLPLFKRHFKENVTNLDIIDKSLVFVVAISELLHPLIISLATSTHAVFISVIFGCLGALSSPIIQSSITKYVPESKMGELFGAIALIKNVLSMVGPPLFLYIYSKTVNGAYPQTVFVFAVFLLSISLSSAFFLKVVEEDQIKLDDVEQSIVDDSDSSLFKSTHKNSFKVNGR